MGCFDIHPALHSLENLLAIEEERKKEQACVSYYGFELSSHAFLGTEVDTTTGMFCAHLELNCFLG